MLVPVIDSVPPPRAEERTHAPGAATVWAAPEAVEAKFEKSAATSSARPQPAGPAPPGAPSLSAIAVTVSTSG